jgi:putative colanic acid biosynthesis acetyltransferase WcaF
MDQIYTKELLEVRLKKAFNKKGFDCGARPFKVYCWYVLSICLFRSGLLPFSNIMVIILRLFGAKIGIDVRIKPGIFIRYPWKLSIDDHSWLADCYIDNLDWIVIGKNVCVSQQAMLQTGNHNYKLASFDLFTKPIHLSNGVWIGARAVVCPGIKAFSHSILTTGAVAIQNLEAYGIYQGNPAVKIRTR